MSVNNNQNTDRNWSNILLSFVLLILAFVIVFVVNKVTTPKTSEIILIDNDGDGYFTISAVRKKKNNSLLELQRTTTQARTY